MPSTDPAVAAAVQDLLHRWGQPAAEFCASGGTALEAALEVLEVGAGAEVVVPDVGCHSVAAAVVRSGAVPVFVGVGEDLTLHRDDVAAACSARTRAVIAVHQYGLPCDVTGIARSLPPDVVVIEDVAQTWGSTTRGVPAGATGTLTVASFGPSKPVSLGAGGALLGPADLVSGAVARGDTTDRHRPRPPSPARFPAPLLPLLPDAIARADRQLARRRAVVDRFRDSDLARHFRLPPLPPGSSAGWTRLPLYPAPSATARHIGQLADDLGSVQPMHPQPPSALPMFHRCEKRVLTGGRRPVEPLLVKIG
ncbi:MULTISPECIES: DegT/DnrJ/EryC1/StrS family aminotransferase [Streptomyces]|uniref:DegT/DnrJ/EryC1/StrS family aminotransferase n=1 Tax=Streptomyces TaxID=1883 RepID=UPI001F332890|nr:DegT/DnrJ/EryC1/StrS family aminotransferase [Streptomyces sp. A1-5]UJB45933.1 DegT/DnrJ/EryC1/StrS family aminotransferase [Streptomyces sp. A1-5]